MKLEAWNNSLYVVIVVMGSIAVGAIAYFRMWDGTLWSIAPLIGVWAVIVGTTTWLAQEFQR